jgi:hypothetical protein
MVHIIDEWNNSVSLVKLEMAPEIVAEFAVEHFVGVRGASLAVVGSLLIGSAGNWGLISPTDFGIVLVFSANVLVLQNPLAEVVNARWAQIRHVVLVSHVDEEVPLRSIVLVCRFQIENVRLHIDRKHGVGVKIENVKVWRLVLECGDRSDDEIHADALARVDVFHHLVKLGVHVREHAESNDVLESVGNGVVSLRILSRALVQVWNVREDDRVSILLLELFQLLNEPFELISRITESGPTSKIGSVANVRVQRNHSRLIVQLLRVVAVVKPGFLVLFSFNELDPVGNPQFDGILESPSSDSDLVLRVGIVIAHGGEDIIAFKSISNKFGCVPHNIDIGYHVQTVKIVRY